MGKGRKIALGTLAGLIGLGGVLLYDSLPSSSQYTQVEKPSRRDIASTSILTPIVITPPNGCPQYVIVRDVSPVSERDNTGWNLLDVNVDLHNDSSCLGTKVQEWEGDLMLGLFGTWKKVDYDDFVFGKVGIVVKWEGGGKEEINISSKDKSVVVPDSSSSFVRVPKAAKNVIVDVDFRANTTDTYRTRGIRDVPYFPGFSKNTKLPTNPNITVSGRPIVDELQSRESVEEWLQYHKSQVARNTGQPLQKAPQETYEEWFRQKIGEFLIDNNLERYRDPAITRLDMRPTTKGLEISLGLTNPTFIENIDLYSSGFNVTDVLDSRGKVIKHYDDPIRFPLSIQNKSLAPQYSTEGKITIRHHHSFPNDAAYLVGSLNLGRYDSESGRVSPPPRLYHDPVVVDVATTGEPEFRGRFGIKGWVLDRFNSIRESFANQ